MIAGSCTARSLGPGADATSVLAEQLLALLIEECSARPAVLVIDDLQWADRATILLLDRLARFGASRSRSC